MKVPKGFVDRKNYIITEIGFKAICFLVGKFWNWYFIKEFILDFNFLKRVNFQLYYVQENALAVSENVLIGSMGVIISMKVII